MLTEMAIKQAKPAERPRRLFDAQGLYLEVAPSGGKWWRLKYRHAGKERRLSFGVYPAVSLKEARQRRDEARKLLAQGMTLAQIGSCPRRPNWRQQRTLLRGSGGNG